MSDAFAATDLRSPRDNCSFPGQQARLRREACDVARRSCWLIAQSPAFADELLSEARLREFKRGSTIVTLQERASSLHFLLRGSVEIGIPSMGQEVVVVHLLSPHDWFGECSALAGIASPAEYRARTHCVTLSVRQAHITRMQLSGHSFIRPMFELISSTAVRMAEIAAGSTRRDPEARVVGKLLRIYSENSSIRGACCVPISQGALADICDLSRTTVSFVLNDLERRELVGLGYARIFIKNRRALAALLGHADP